MSEVTISIYNGRGFAGVGVWIGGCDQNTILDIGQPKLESENSGYCPLLNKKVGLDRDGRCLETSTSCLHHA